MVVLDKTLSIIGAIFLAAGACIFVAMISAGFWGHDYFGLKGLSYYQGKGRLFGVVLAFTGPGFVLLKTSDSMKKKRLKKELMDEGKKKYLEN